MYGTFGASLRGYFSPKCQICATIDHSRNPIFGKIAESIKNQRFSTSTIGWLVYLSTLGAFSTRATLLNLPLLGAFLTREWARFRLTNTDEYPHSLDHNISVAARTTDYRLDRLYDNHHNGFELVSRVG